jgi:hypothetical protein
VEILKAAIFPRLKKTLHISAGFLRDCHTYQCAKSKRCCSDEKVNIVPYNRNSQRRKKMLTIAGVSFAMTMLLFFIDKLVDRADVDLSWPARALIFASLILLALGYYTKLKYEPL